MQYSNSNPSGAAKLALVIAGIAVCWLVLLPWLAEQTGAARRVEQLEAAGLDPGALFYTDHERARWSPAF